MKKIFSKRNTSSFIFILILLVLLNITYNTIYDYFNLFLDNIIYYYSYILTIFLSLRIVIFFYKNKKEIKFNKYIINIIFQILLPLNFIISSIYPISLFVTFWIFISIYVVLYWFASILINFKLNSIKRWYKSDNIDYVGRILMYFIISVTIPLIISSYFFSYIYTEINIWTIILYILWNIIFFILFWFLLYWLFSYIYSLVSLKKYILNDNNINKYIYLKILTFYKYSKSNLTDQFFLFLSYIIPNFKKKYIHFLYNKKLNKAEIYNYFIDNFRKELVFEEYQNELVDNLTKYNIKKSDLNIEELINEIIIINEKEDKKLLSQTKIVMLSLWIVIDTKDVVYSHPYNEISNIIIYRKKINTYIKNEISNIYKQKDTLNSSEFIKYLEEKKSNYKNNIIKYIYKLLSKLIYVLIGMISILSAIFFYTVNYLNNKSIDLIEFLILYYWNNEKLFIETINKLENNEFFIQIMIFLNSSNWKEFTNNILQYFSYLIIAIIIYFILLFIFMWLNQFIKLRMKQIDNIIYYTNQIKNIKK